MKRALYQVLHYTHYRYSAPVSLAQQLAHLWPRDCARQLCQEHRLTVTPQPTARQDGLDTFGNPLTRLVFERPHEQLRVIASLRVEVLARDSLALDDSPAWESAVAALGYSGQRAVLGGLADLLLQIAEVSGRVSDQLALRFFVHVDASRGTLSS